MVEKSCLFERGVGGFVVVPPLCLESVHGGCTNNKNSKWIRYNLDERRGEANHLEPIVNCFRLGNSALNSVHHLNAIRNAVSTVF